MVSLLNGTNLISITNLGLNLNIATTDLILSQGISPIQFGFFSELSKLQDYSMDLVETYTF